MIDFTIDTQIARPPAQAFERFVELRSRLNACFGLEATGTVTLERPRSAAG